MFRRNSYKIAVYCFRETRRSGLVRPASKSCRFSHHPLRVPKAWHRDFAACGQRSGLLALNLASIFEKLLDQKTFILLRFVTENTALRKATRIRFGKAGAHPQLVESYTNSLFFLEKTVFPVRQKGGSTPAFAYQHAAIAPLPCLNL